MAWILHMREFCSSQLMHLLVICFFCMQGSALSAQTSEVDYAIIVHPETAVTNLSLAEATRIFKREKQSWGGQRKTSITLVLPPVSSDSMAVVLKRVYKMDARGLKQHWVQMIYRNKITKRPKQLPNSKLLKRIVAKTRGAVSIVKASEVSKSSGVKILKIDGKAPDTKGYVLRGKSTATVQLEAASGIGFQLADLGVLDVREASLEASDGDSDERLTRLEDDMAELQMELLMGGSDDQSDGGAPLLAINGFGHVTLTNDTSAARTGANTAFALGGLDLFITSQLSDHLSFLNETVFEPTDTGEYVLDVERALIKYRFDDELNIQAGRFHTKIGHWNEIYHHGEWLSTSIGRPAILNFEDEDGLLPVHMIGIGLGGQANLDESVLSWSLEVGNGRGAEPDPPQNALDANDAKAVNLNLAIQPSWLDGWIVGGGAYIDDIPAGAGHGALDELILSVYAAYERGPIQFNVEYFGIDHEEQSGASVSSSGYYTQLGYSFGEWTPYLRLDSTDISDSDVFFASTDDQRTLAGGVRYDYSSWSALKLQYDRTSTSPSGGGSDNDSGRLALQVSFAF